MELEILCRFCAEFKPVAKVYNLQSDINLNEEIQQKVNFVQAILVNLCAEETYPAAVCFVCKESLDHAYHFFKRVNKAQEVVLDLLTKHELYRASSEQSTSACIKIEAPHNVILFEVEPPKIVPDFVTTDSKHVESHENVNQDWDADQDWNVDQCGDVGQDGDIDQSGDIDQDDIDQSGDIDQDDIDQSGDIDQDDIDQSGDIDHDEDKVQEEETDQDDEEDQTEDEDEDTSEKSLSQTHKTIEKPKIPESWKRMRWICDHCNDEFPDMRALRSHAMSAHETCRAFKCPDCQTSYGAKCFTGFIRHMRRHYKHLRKYCIHCNKKFATANTTIAHSKDHLNEKYMCGYCGTIFNNEIDLQEHLNIYSLRQRNPKKHGEGQDIADRTCRICNKVFQSTAYIPEHMTIHLGKRRIYTCDRCGKTFSGKGSLACHLHSHVEEKNFCCKICNKTFSVRSRLVQHITRHSDVKKFKCEECGKRFKISRQLKEHRLIHTDYMPFSCEVCAKQFRRKNNLKQHLLQHTGEKPYPCEVCDKSFTDVGNRNKHMKRVHNKDVVKRLEVTEENTEEIEKWKETLKLEKNLRKRRINVTE